MEGISGGATTEKSLYDATAMRDIQALHELLKSDPLLLDRVSFTFPNKTPLHIATVYGHLDFVQEILNHNRILAKELDSQQSSALHIASANGYLEIVSELLKVAPDMCFSRDSQGRNPLHLAAVKGHGPVLEELVRVAPVAAWDKVDRGVGLLHLCVKHKQLEAMKFLLENFSDMINDRDDDGDTVLHMAVRDGQIETIQYLLSLKNIDVNVKNSKGQTASNILEQTSDSQLRELLNLGLFNNKSNQITHPEKWLTKKRDSIMVVAILIATMAFQAGVSPAGGVWQESSKEEDSHGGPHRAGEAVMAHIHPKAFKSFIRSNTVAFVSSLSTILLLISGLPFRRKLFMWILMVIMWLTITSIAVTYGISIVVVTPKKDSNSLSHVMDIGIGVWGGVMGILLVGNTVRLIDRWLKNKGIIVWRRFRNLFEVKNKNFGQADV